MKKHEKNKKVKIPTVYHKIIKIIIKIMQYEKSCNMKRVKHEESANWQKI